MSEDGRLCTSRHHSMNHKSGTPGPGMSKMHQTNRANRRVGRPDWIARTIAGAIAAAVLALGQQSAVADPIGRAQAKRMYDRLTGTPPSPETLDELEAYIAANGASATAMYIMNNESDPRSSYFYSV